MTLCVFRDQNAPHALVALPAQLSDWASSANVVYLRLSGQHSRTPLIKNCILWLRALRRFYENQKRSHRAPARLRHSFTPRWMGVFRFLCFVERASRSCRLRRVKRSVDQRWRRGAVVLKGERAGTSFITFASSERFWNTESQQGFRSVHFCLLYFLKSDHFYLLTMSQNAVCHELPFLRMTTASSFESRRMEIPYYP